LGNITSPSSKTSEDPVFKENYTDEIMQFIHKSKSLFRNVTHCWLYQDASPLLVSKILVVMSTGSGSETNTSSDICSWW